MPDKMSIEKINRLKGMGAQVVVIDELAADDPRSYYETAKRLVRETRGAFYPNQYHSPDNIERTTSPRVPRSGRAARRQLDAFISGLGTRHDERRGQVP